MRPLAEALRGTLAALGIGGAVGRAAAVRAWPEVARACIGVDAGRTRALRVDGDTLLVTVPSPVLAQELRLRSEEIRVALHRLAPDAGVRAVRFIPSGRAPVRSA
ncbi:MAG TPA: DciA family protein [Candidatus Dormibacteraeota bacterium]|jgi:hypothetical protein|nr:DciA family protein [Candidatus Dormibacteraeota bacterium]